MFISRRQLQCTRRFSFFKSLATWNVHPSIRTLTKTLARNHPKFTLPPSKIQVLFEPKQFYGTLLDMIRRAQKRIFFSSLYIGSSEHELVSALAAALRKNQSLELFLQLDLNRSTRPGPSSTAKIMLPLLRDFPTRVHVSMFRSPALSGFAAMTVPPRFNEGWGTWHAKIYGVDDEVLISGANLNKSYFTNRKDRYMHITESPRLAQYCFNFLQMISALSFRLLPTTTMTTRMASSPYSVVQEDYVLQWSDSDTHPHHIHKKARDALTAFQASDLSTPLTELAADGQVGNGTSPEPSVMLFPIIQAGQFGIREEESALQSLFRDLDSHGQASSRRPLLDLTSGYFGLHRPYQDLILESSNVDTRIVCSAPKANGFFGSKGISGRIPEGYTYLEQRFMRAVRDAGRDWTIDPSGSGRGIQLSEWEKDGWTYHAKGIWLSPSPKSLPILTMFGSTNLNSRSAHLDTELSFLMVIPSELSTDCEPASDPGSSERERLVDSVLRLRQQLQMEIHRIRECAAEWKGTRREVGCLTKAIVHLVKGML